MRQVEQYMGQTPRQQRAAPAFARPPEDPMQRRRRLVDAAARDWYQQIQDTGEYDTDPELIDMLVEDGFIEAATKRDHYKATDKLIELVS